MSCSFGNRGVQLILAYSWARAAVLAAGKVGGGGGGGGGGGRGGNVIISSVPSFSFISLFFPFPSLSSPLLSLLSLFSLSLGDDTK